MAPALGAKRAKPPVCGAVWRNKRRGDAYVRVWVAVGGGLLRFAPRWIARGGGADGSRAGIRLEGPRDAARRRPLKDLAPGDNARRAACLDRRSRFRRG